MSRCAGCGANLGWFGSECNNCDGGSDIEPERQETNNRPEVIPYNDYSKLFIDTSKLATSASVRNCVKSCRAKNWTDDEIREAFEHSRIDIDQYL